MRGVDENDELIDAIREDSPEYGSKQSFPQMDPSSALKTTLKAEIDPDAWATLNSDTSLPFESRRRGGSR
jgi:hypothetical protein